MEFPKKYCQDEIERRWLVDSSKIPDLSHLPYWDVRDLYVHQSRLRLRHMSHSQSSKDVFKLCKKYGITENYCEPITNIYLSVTEYQLLEALPGDVLLKRKYQIEHQGHPYSIEEFISPSRDFYLCESEYSSVKAAKQAVPPEFAGEDITADVRYHGSELAKY